MADYSALRDTINNNIVPNNGRQEITGEKLNSVLNSMVDVLGEGYTFLGVATPTTNPTTPEGKAYYLAGAAGTYSNFGNIVVAADEVALLVWGGTAWSKVVTGAASKEEVSQLGQEVGGVPQRIELIDGEYVDSSTGALTPYAGWSRTNYLLVTGITSLEGNNPGSVSSYNAFYDRNKNFISNFSVNTNEAFSIPVPADAVWCVLSNRTNSLNQLTLANLPPIPSITDRIDELETSVGSLGAEVEDLGDVISGGAQTISYIDGEYVNGQTGNFVSSAGWSRTNYLDVEGLVGLSYNNPSYRSIYNAFYDEDKTFISSFPLYENFSGVAPVPFRAKWCVISCPTSQIRQVALTLPNKLGMENVKGSIVESQDINVTTATSIAEIEDFLSNLIPTRINFTFSVLLSSRIEVKMNSGYNVSFELMADDAILYSSNWEQYINLQSTLYDYPSANRIRIYFRKADASNITIAELEASVEEMVIDYASSPFSLKPNTSLANNILNAHGHSEEGTGINDLNPEKEVVTKLGNLNRRYISYGGSETQHPPVLSFIHMSDAHADNDNIIRIKEFYDSHSDYINGGVIDTGDFIGQNLAQGLPSAVSEVPDFIRILGNHDAYYYVNNTWQLAPQIDCYNICFKDYIGRWGVVQPANAAVNGYCYFYKDFAENGVMMVALDYDHWDSTQNTWLVNTLSTALSGGRHVVILVHRAPFRITADISNPFQNVDYINRTFADHDPMTDVYTDVKNFIDAGGNFVCYLCGHLHDDYFGLGRDADTSNQLVIGVGCASGRPSATVSGTMSRIAGQRSQDCFNVVGIDTTSKTIKIMRIGADYDRYMRKKNTLSWDYGTGQLIYVD